jgi:hypothetical protein
LREAAVHQLAHHVLTAWAQAVHDGRLDREIAFGILAAVRDAHTPVDAMSRFLYGAPEHDQLAVVEARYQLANLKSCRHSVCPRTGCPIERQPATSSEPESEPLS